MRYWWVNQNQTYRAEVRGSFMWSPKQNANGVRNQFYENMREVSPGDVVFSFCDTRIKAIGVVTGSAQTGPKPDFGAAGSNWSREGWFCSGGLLRPEQPDTAEGTHRHSSAFPAGQVLAQ
jgi:putative restriction endonuclease